MTSRKRIIGALIAGGLTFATAAPAFAGDTGTGKCNSGRGNNSETDPASDCDPGNSGGHNKGGD